MNHANPRPRHTGTDDEKRRNATCHPQSLLPTPPPMPHLLLINPNTSTTTSALLERALRPGLPPGAQLTVRTAGFGARYIACESSHAVAGTAVLQAWAEHLAQAQEAVPQAPQDVGNTERSPLDGVLIGCFGDPGLFALREASACPVTGLAEASFIEAARLGPFAVVTGGERWKPMLRRLALALGFSDALLHIETVTPTGAQMQADRALALHHLRQACRAAALPGVRSVIVGGAGLAGYAHTLQPQVDLPLIDSVQAGLKVLLESGAPAPQRRADGFVADWSAVTPQMARLTVSA